ncbi:unnamed protein product [Acanthoscelides obtectus]|uniref:DUF753 domain-containing protein n=1 Tax=Acanthoscelides obtectus TaxID=200917 RepID=A0A9P0KDH7_ACAOB|nr:unnamed protein product [Acanthoscelides obtectus]CAK1645509.1 hypothetical protein AOBTE_LOCUS14133 [Acanthoscelides obtectus]
MIMVYCKTALLLAFGFIALTSVDCHKCYQCIDLGETENDVCVDHQNSTSPTVDCDGRHGTDCLQVTFFVRPLNKSVTIRDCLSSGMTCEYFDFIPNIAVKKCKTCNEDLCNGD